MSIQLADNLSVNTSKPIDDKYGPWASTSAAETAIPLGSRYTGLTVGVFESGVLTEYWWKDDITASLSLKNLGTTYTFSTGLTDTSNTITVDTSVVQTVSNIATNVVANGGSDTKYPSVKAIKTYVDGLFTSPFSDRGIYNPSITSPGAYPTTGGSGALGAIQAGDFWTIGRDGYLLTNSVGLGSILRALDNTPGQDADKWALLDTAFGYVAENTANKVSAIDNLNNTSTVKYPSVKAVVDYVATKTSTPGLDTVLGAGASATNKSINLTSDGSTDYLVKVENSNFSNRKSELRSDGVYVYDASSTGNKVTYLYNSLVYTNGSNFKTLTLDFKTNANNQTFTFPSTGGTLATQGSFSITPVANGGISYTAPNISAVYNTALSGTAIKTEKAVGSIAAGTTVNDLKGKTIVELFDSIFFPVQLPTYTIPTISMSGTVGIVAGIKEIGTSISGTTSVTGIKNDAGVFTALSLTRTVNGTATIIPGLTLQTVSPPPDPVGNAGCFGYQNPNDVLGIDDQYHGVGKYITYTIPSYTIPLPGSGQTSSTTVFSGTGDYDAGLAKQNNRNVTDTTTPAVRSTTAPQDAATNFATTNNITITGIYPYFFGTYTEGSTAPSSSVIKSLIEALPWSSVTAYVVGNFVKSGTTLYKCILACTNIAVTNATYWTNVGNCTKVISVASSDLSITYGNGSDFRWWFFAYNDLYTSKNYWTEVGSTIAKNVAIGGDYTISTNISLTSPDALWSNIPFQIYISKNKVKSTSNTTVYKYTVNTLP